MGKNIVYQGGPGSGQHTKMCNQIMAASLMVGMCETLLYAYRAGLDPETMLMSVGRGAAACWMLDNLAPRVLKRDFSPGFYVEHFIKDMGIALGEAERMGLVLPGLSLVRQLYVAAKAQGHGRKGTQALLLALESISGIERKDPKS
jgi:3-hydroxyisobutyrate dehydrogenase